MSTDLEQSILKTICWFSVFGRPISRFEVWKWLLEPSRSYDLAEVLRCIDLSPWVKERIVERDGYCLLREQEQQSEYMIQTRSFHYVDAVQKYQKLKRAASYIRLFSGVRFVAAVNSIAWFDTGKESDIDLYIVTKPNRIWSTRFWTVAPFLLFGRRPGATTEDPFCFSFFATTKMLALDSLRLKEGDHYLAFWLKSLVPIFDAENFLGTIRQQNIWADRMLPHVSLRPIHRQHQPSVPRIFSIPSFGLSEFVYRFISRRRFPKHIRERANLDSTIVISDEMLKFHEKDRRAEFEGLFKECVQRVCA